ncbi:hypothetical protein FN846DRAFT_892251 [Sphaerosporella brunnea]|uniref:Uncharacterized protein n=1 Tax=Sphaerosporella brunnea TaxID=1250544 RepID=A0A5J5ERX8_9PEZI|nr:hypothetical protein FN846DRAFT_892251 [Sphaerosporella brunnea]
MTMSQISSSAPFTTAASSTAPSSQCEKGISDSQSTVSPGLSSARSGLFTPTLGSDPAKPEQQESQDPRVPDIFLGKRNDRTSIIWNPENGHKVEMPVRGHGGVIDVSPRSSSSGPVLEIPCLSQR